jgi:hypothetical protein
LLLPHSPTTSTADGHTIHYTLTGHLLSISPPPSHQPSSPLPPPSSLPSPPPTALLTAGWVDGRTEAARCQDQVGTGTRITPHWPPSYPLLQRPATILSFLPPPSYLPSPPLPSPTTDEPPPRSTDRQMVYCTPVQYVCLCLSIDCAVLGSVLCFDDLFAPTVALLAILMSLLVVTTDDFVAV